MTMHPFYDTHTHLVAYGVSLNRPGLGRCRSFDDVVETLGPAGQADTDEWLVGRDFDESEWKRRRLPTLREMDAAFPARPVVLRRVCGHIAVTNTPGLRRIDEKWSAVHRDAGLLEEDVVLRLDEVIDVSEKEIAEGVRRGVGVAHSLGIAGSAEIVNFRQFNVLKKLSDELSFRFHAHLPFGDAVRLVEEGVKGGSRFGYLRFHGIKVFMDGSLGGRTAALREPYNDADTRGMLLTTAEELREVVEFAEKSGLRVMAHAIGDRAIAETLKGFTDVCKGNENGHCIEHAEVLDSNLIRKIARSGLRLSVQPNFPGRWSGEDGMNMARLGRERHRWCNPYRSLLNAGIPVGFGSDCMPLDPFFGLRSAITHPVFEERISRERALELYTSTARELIGMEERSGDGMELSGDPFDPDTSVVSLKVGGRVVYSQ